MIIGEDGTVDLENGEFDNVYIENFIYKLIPFNRGTAETWDFPQVESIIIHFEYAVVEGRIKLPISYEDFSKDQELIKRVDKFNLVYKKDYKLRLEPLYYLTLFVYNLATNVTVDSVYIGEKRLNQLAETLELTEESDCEITIKSGKGKTKIIDRELIDLIFNIDKIRESLTDEDRKMLRSSDVDLKRKSDKFSFTDRAAVFTGYLFEYFDRDNQAKELISYLAYISEIVTNDSIIASNDYMNILLRNYKSIRENDKKQLSPLLYVWLSNSIIFDWKVIPDRILTLNLSLQRDREISPTTCRESKNRSKTNMSYSNNDAPVMVEQKINEEVKELLQLSKVLASGKKLAKIKNNRVISDRNVSEKKQSIKKYGVLQPITIYDGKEVIKQDYKIADLETGKEISEDQAENYIVIIDGQHRIAAYMDLKSNDPEFDRPCYVMYSLATDGTTIAKELAEINVTVRTWKGSDYPSYAVMTIGEDMYPLIAAISKLTSNGYSLDAACKYLTFKNEITKSVLVKVAEGKVNQPIKNKITLTKGIERGERILQSASSRIKEDLLKTRTIADWIIGKYDDLSESETGSFTDDICSFFESLSRKQVEKIETAKGERGKTTKEDIIFSLLTQFYDEFKTNQSEKAA